MERLHKAMEIRGLASLGRKQTRTSMPRTLLPRYAPTAQPSDSVVYLSATLTIKSLKMPLKNSKSVSSTASILMYSTTKN